MMIQVLSYVMHLPTVIISQLLKSNVGRRIYQVSIVLSMVIRLDRQMYMHGALK